MSLSITKKIFTPNNETAAKYKQSDLCITIDDKISILINNKIEYGIVRFIGSLNGKNEKDIFYGLELEKSIGKNAGSYNKIEYFRCASKKGLFVKRSRIKSLELPNCKQPRICVGDIIKIGGKYRCKGVIKYIGCPSFKRLQGGNWFGIELKKKLGKTNGTINNIKYFKCKDGFGIFISSKLISICNETHDIISKNDNNNNNDIKENDNDQLVIQNVKSNPNLGSLGLMQIRKKTMTRSRSKTVDRPHHTSKKERKHRKKSLDEIEENKEMELDQDSISFRKQFIINNYGYPITFLLSDRKPNISILREEIINTFGHIELLDNQQIYITNVDKMCLLIRISFHYLKSSEKAINWKFWWKKKSVTMKRHSFKKWREEIEIKEIYPIYFKYKESNDLTQDEIRKFLIEYCNNLEELYQHKSQIQFEKEDESTKCIINFGNKKARDLLFNSKYIELEHNNNIHKLQWTMGVESIPISI